MSFNDFMTKEAKLRQAQAEAESTKSDTPAKQPETAAVSKKDEAGS